jgi:molybdopterin-containing oxidoreductase family iron-sulfur binding subunit
MPQIDRRDFLKLVGVSAGAAASAGCSDPVQKLIPYVVQPEEITPGLPVIYASTCRECPVGCGLHVRTREGRPVKLEGNPEHPINRGALCARGQAGTQRTYHPGRHRGPLLRGADGALSPLAWDAAVAELARRLAAAGPRAWVLGGEVGPTLGALVDRFVAALGAGGRVVYEPFDRVALRAAARSVFGVDARPIFDLSRADLVVDFGSDFLETWISPVEHARQFAQARDVAGEHHGARLVYVGPRQSLTASNADEWLAPVPGSEGVLALALARVAAERRGAQDPALDRALARVSVEDAAVRTGIDAATIHGLGERLAASAHPIALPPGAALAGRRATATTAAVLMLDAALGAVGDGLVLPTGTPGSAQPAPFAEVVALVDAMRSGDVEVLIVHDANPLYSLPADLGFAEALAKVGFVVSTAPIADETSARAHLVLPDHTPLESWGDAAPVPGVRSIVQPSLRPLYDTRAFGDTLLDVGRAVSEEVAAKLPAGSFRSVLEAAWAGSDWRSALARGGVFEATASRGRVPVAPSAADLDVEVAKLDGDGAHALLAVPSPLLYDGRGADLPWLQETPDPVTKVAWESWAEISHETARALGVEFGDVIAIEMRQGTLELPVLPRGGIRDDVVAVPLGQGHTVGSFAGRADGTPRGVNVSAALPAATDESGGRAWLTTRARLARTGRSARLPLTQKNDNQRGRQIAESIPLAALVAGGEGEAAAHGSGHAAASHEIRRPYDPVDDSTADSPYRWGMTIDLDRCNGCSACIVACSIENNVPIVGEQGVLRNRQMQWLRIERYVGPGEPEFGTGRPGPRSRESLGDTDVRHIPALCQQCGAAPCEPVCPVLATYHSPEGLNGMIYNRCIGTRYCSNNCPYKVRRFNWFDYGIGAWPEPMRLGLNPDVTVRGQGVMEKCTFCIQRIESGRQRAKDEGRPIADGEVTPACAQTCPTQAITFGNLKDDASRARQRAAQAAPRAYHQLHVLNTRPSITYLAKVRRAEEGHRG